MKGLGYGILIFQKTNYLLFFTVFPNLKFLALYTYRKRSHVVDMKNLGDVMLIFQKNIYLLNLTISDNCAKLIAYYFLQIL